MCLVFFSSFSDILSKTFVRWILRTSIISFVFIFTNFRPILSSASHYIDWFSDIIWSIIRTPVNHCFQDHWMNCRLIDSIDRFLTARQPI